MSPSSYLTQSLRPLTPDSSTDGERDYELYDCQTVCGAHGFIKCPRCPTNYTINDGLSSDGEDSGVDTNTKNDAFDEEIRSMYEKLSLGARSAFRARYGKPPPRHEESEDQSETPCAIVDVPKMDCKDESETPCAIVDVPKMDCKDDSETPCAIVDVPKMNCKDDSEIPRPLVDAPKVEIENACQQSRGTGQVFPTEFTPRSALVKPTTLFRARAHGSGTRYIHQDDAEKQLIFTRGACLNNGQQNVKAGWAFVSGPGSHGGPPHTTSGRLETAGPFGEPSHQSIHRAELRAVIAALRSRAWNNDGVKTIVIATDSDYVTMGATMWAKSWIKKDWVKCGRPVKNRDLWEVLLGEAEELDEQGVSVQFWQIQRDWNTVADAAAKEAAAEDEAVGK